MKVQLERLEKDKAGKGKRTRKLCQGYIVMYKKQGGEWTHMQLAAFIEAADKDEALYDGLANTVMVQHFAVNTDAAMAQDGIESCETFKRLIKVLEV